MIDLFIIVPIALVLIGLLSIGFLIGRASRVESESKKAYMRGYVDGHRDARDVEWTEDLYDRF